MNIDNAILRDYDIYNKPRDADVNIDNNFGIDHNIYKYKRIDTNIGNDFIINYNIYKSSYTDTNINDKILINYNIYKSEPGNSLIA